MTELRFLTALPVYNEAAHVSETLAEVRRYSQDILVVNDGSSDDTADILAQERGITVLHHDVNQGYGAALNTAFAYALKHGYDILVSIDCDGQHEPKLIPKLVEQIGPEGSFDMVSGSRYLKAFPGDSLPPEDRRRINLDITAQLNERLQLSLTDGFCGFKAYRVSSLADLEITELGYAMPLQLWVQAVSAGWEIIEFPVPLVYLEEERSFGGSLDDARRRMAYYEDVLEREFSAHRNDLTRQLTTCNSSSASREIDSTGEDCVEQ